MIEMNEVDLCSVSGTQPFEQFHGLGHKRMRHLAHWPCDLAVGVKCSIEEQDVIRPHYIREGRLPFAPFVDIGNEDERSRRSFDTVADSFGELVAMRDKERFDRYSDVYRNGDLIGNGYDNNVFEADQLGPRSIFMQHPSHSRHGKDLDLARVYRFAAKVHQARVMADVCVRQEDAVDPVGTGYDRSLENFELLRQIRRSVKDPAFPAVGVDERNGRDRFAKRAVRPRTFAKRRPAAHLRHARVLARAEHEDIWRCRERRDRHREENSDKDSEWFHFLGASKVLF